MNKFDLDSFKVGADIRNGCWSKVYIKGDLVLKEYKSEEEVRKETKRDLAEGFLAELNSLNSLRGRSNFPKLIDYDENKKWILMSRHGLPLSRDNKIPRQQFEEQIKKIRGILSKKRIDHGDISRNNLLWDGNKLVLIDFNEATIRKRPKNKLHPSCYRFFSDKKEVSSKAQEIIEEKCRKKHGFGGNRLYQSLLDEEGTPDRGFTYQRDLKKRWDTYQIPLDCLQNKRILDIGCNLGGFSVFCNQMECKSYLGIDADPMPINIAQEVYRRENTSFLNIGFGDLDYGDVDPNEGIFDTVFSFAVHRYICRKHRLKLEQYLDQIVQLLHKEGSIFFETHPRRGVEGSLSNFNIITKRKSDKNRYYYHLKPKSE